MRRVTLFDLVMLIVSSDVCNYFAEYGLIITGRHDGKAYKNMHYDQNYALISEAVSFLKPES